jgi:dienelactone hydrolase
MRRFACTCFAAAALLELGLVGPSPAAAAELVKFPSVATSFPQANGSGSGAGLSPEAAGIEGYLSKPKGEGPFPAVVVLHSCLGLRADRQSIAGALTRWGYVALFVDDFVTRGIRQTCAVDFPQALPDAFGALEFITGLPYVDKARIAALGYSQGADTALQIAASPAAPALPGGAKFRAAVAFYPPCENQANARLRLPTLILVGAADTVTPAAACEALVRRQSATADVRLLVYPGAAHVFDDPAFAGGKSFKGMWLQFDQQSAAKARGALHDFLAARLAR